MTTTTTTTTDQDRTCAILARAALFPKRMHRDVADASHFPALLQLDLLRDQYLSNSTFGTPGTTSGSFSGSSISSVFPRHVVVVRNLSPQDGGGNIQWNGEPDLIQNETKFEVIPNHLSVTCSSSCDDALLTKGIRFYRRSVGAAATGAQAGGQQEGEEEEIVLCSDRILQKDSKDKKYKGVAKELPPKSYQAVEEVLAHALFQVRHNNNNNNNKMDDNDVNVKKTANIEIEAAKAAECYFSRHPYEDRQQIKKGSRLQTGYSWLPSFVQNWSMNKCLMAVAKEHLVAQSMIAQQDAQAAVEAALKNQ